MKYQSAVFGVLALLSVACGSNDAIISGGFDSCVATNTCNTGGGNTGGGNNGGGNNGGNNGGGNTGGTPAMQFQLFVTGNGYSHTPAFSTDSILEYRVRAGDDGYWNIPGTGYNGYYDCTSYSMQVVHDDLTPIGAPITSGIVKASTTNMFSSMQCMSADPVSDIFSFTPAGNGSFRVKVSAVKTSFQCQAFFFNCPLSNLYSTHQTSAIVEVRLNGQQFQN